MLRPASTTPITEVHVYRELPTVGARIRPPTISSASRQPLPTNANAAGYGNGPSPGSSCLAFEAFGLVVAGDFFRLAALRRAALRERDGTRPLLLPRSARRARS